MQRSRASQFLIVPPMLRARPADTERYTACTFPGEYSKVLPIERRYLMSEKQEGLI